MARKRHFDEDIVKLLREIEVRLASGSDVSTACRAAGISDATHYVPRHHPRDILKRIESGGF
jgi:putative transposase